MPTDRQDSEAKTAPTTLPASVQPSRAYLTATVTEDGELVETPRFKYLPGHPRQIRFDAKAGVFNVGGEKVLGNTLRLIPMALRVFSDDILNMGRKLWAELFYIDEQGIVCAVLFHGYSVENLQKLNASLFYDDLRLTDVVLTAKAAKKENKKVGGSYFIAEFTYAPADPAEVQARQEFAHDHAIYREETVTPTAELRLTQGYRLPQRSPAEPLPAQLEASPT